MTTNKNNLSDISDNSLEELLDLINKIDRKITLQYFHINDHLSKDFLNAVDTESIRLIAEMDRRQNEQNS